MTGNQDSSPLRTLSTAYFALPMATGIVSIGSHLLGHQAIALALFAFNVVAYAVLWIAYLARALIYPRDFFGDMVSHAKGPGYLTMVAGSSLLGSQFWIFTSWHSVSVALWALAIVLWVALLYTFFVGAVVREPKPTLEAGINGGWMVITVATQSIAILGSFVIAELPRPDIVLFVCLAFFLLGGMFYILLIALILYRWLFFHMDPAELTPPYWINMGAVAITTLAGSRLLLYAEAHPIAAQLAPFLAAFVLMFWATATWWIPALVAVGLWKHLVERIPITYNAGYWSMVFPLGMYTTATFTYAQALRVEFLDFIPQGFIWIAWLAWALTCWGMLRRLVALARGQASVV